MARRKAKILVPEQFEVPGLIIPILEDFDISAHNVDYKTHWSWKLNERAHHRVFVRAGRQDYVFRDTYIEDIDPENIRPLESHWYTNSNGSTIVNKRLSQEQNDRLLHTFKRDYKHHRGGAASRYNAIAALDPSKPFYKHIAPSLDSMDPGIAADIAIYLRTLQ